MSDEERSRQRNILIITIADLVFVFIIVGYILLNSTLNNEPLCFHYVQNGQTGEPLGLLMSVFLYILFWFFIVGGIPSAIVFLFSQGVYVFLHRKDEKLFDSHYHPVYETEYFYGGLVAFSSSYLAALILLILHISNIATINIF